MDDIQRKLALIDKQFSGIPSHEFIFGNCPLVFIMFGLVSGIIIQYYLFFPTTIWFGTIFLNLIIIIVLFVFKTNPAKNRYFSAYLALICFLCLGSIRLTSYIQPKSNDIRICVPDEPVLATIRGYIKTEPHTSKFADWKFSRFMPSDPGSSFYIQTSEIETKSGWSKINGTVRVFVDEIVLDLSPGDYIQAYCWLDTFKPPSNPGQFDTADYLAKKGVFVGASIKSRSGIRLIQKSGKGTFTFIKSKIRELAEVALLGDMTNDESNGLLQALLLGFRGNIDSDTNEAFRKTGLSHFISLSGLHMGIIIGIIWWFSKITGFMKRGRSVICIIAIIIFLMVIPPKAPTLRASIIAMMFCLSFIIRRRAYPINTLSLSAIILLLIRPTQLFEAGWQLSFVSVLGIILFSKNIYFFLHEKIDDLIPAKSSDQTRRNFYSIAFIADKAIALFSVGLAAWIASAGILLYHFHTITPLASLWTVLVFPFVSAILILGFLKILLFFIFPTISALLGILVSCLSILLISIVKLLARLDISQILIGHVSLRTIYCFYFVIIVFILLFYSYPALRRKLIFAAFPLIIIFTGVLKWQHTNNDNLVLTCLDVGHGQSIFLQSPDGKNILFDAGSMYISNIGQRIVIPFLNYSGINKIDAVMISHNDIDHINGIPEIAKFCNVGNVYANDDFFSKTDEWGTASFLNECLHETSTEIQPLDKINISSKKVQITTLWPKQKDYLGQDLSDNNKSLVILIEFLKTKILICSDIEQFAQKELMRIYPDLKANIVVVPHHGSSNTLEKGFLESLEADIFICSTDKTPSIKCSGQLFYTSRDGAVTISIDKQGNEVVRTHNKKSD
ncbi:MAG: DNA internalization-related competence protein ComEC/Rec2 [Sedimentisphaerales bacterium]|nr:DNA internalization-related competence protein ComEC/Rec2 [Sedimentisphaerales bacterium]